MIKRTAAGLILWAFAAGPSVAGGCVLDYEAFVVRSALPDDATTIEEQSATNADWYVSGDDVVVLDQRYTRFGLPRVVSPKEIEFHAFRGSVPLFREAGVAEEPPAVIYASTAPETCEVQPYQRIR